MRLKTFSAKSMKAVMAQVRESMGADAVIVSVEQGGKGHVRVTAAADRDLPPPRTPETPEPRSTPAAEEERRGPSVVSRDFDAADLKAAVAHHGLPPELGERILALSDGFQVSSLAEALAQAFDSLVRIAPLAPTAARPVMLIGPPGAGKTVSAAKLAAEAAVNGHGVRLVTTDTVKASGIDQLAHYAEMMEVPVAAADSESALAREVAAAQEGELVLIDSCGLNPFVVEELETAVRFIRAAEAEPVLVLPAGIDGLEAADMAEIFAEMGARRFIATRLDTARRYGSILTAARAGRLALAGFARSPYLAEPLETPSALGLARLFASLPDRKATTPVKERMS